MTPDYLIVHHSLTKDSQTVSWTAIRHYHTLELMWNDIGYHFGVELVNDEYEVLAGRPMDVQGAHCKERRMNSRALGICFIGNFDLAPPNEVMLQRGARVLKPIVQMWGIPHYHVLPHSHFATYKTCPGKLFPMDHFISMLY